MTRGSTLFEKIWDPHVVKRFDGGRDLIFVDRHILQETTCAPAFAGLARAGRPVAHPALTLATQDHIVSTEPDRTEASNPEGVELMRLMRANAAAHGIRHYGIEDARQGIVHVIGPELGAALPGTVLACGDSHTSTVGGLGALGIGVGTSEVEHVLATQTLLLQRPQTMRIRLEGRKAPGVSAKDLILAVIGRFGIAAGRSHAVEYAGPVIRALGLEERLTVCNMSIELGARLGLIAPDDTTFAYLAGRPFAPRGADWDLAMADWRALASAEDAVFERDVAIDCAPIAPQVTWGTTQEDVIGIDQRIPDPALQTDPERRRRSVAALGYMGLAPGDALEGLKVDVVFIGSCTNGRLSDLEAAAAIARGRKVKADLRAVVVPGSASVKRAAEAKGLDRVFREAGFEWRSPGCSMCVSINQDVVPPGARCVATTNRNFEGRQGPGSRTHLASPAMAAAAAVSGAIVDVRRLAS
ncbi:MAG: 3-isopropylmalate dehydratase large subunit [Alphaproteobacteria bacterium]|nr:3-isopropylmalate dehydratase large subunit [Alphaproteobacteria bacterium]